MSLSDWHLLRFPWPSDLATRFGGIVHDRTDAAVAHLLRNRARAAHAGPLNHPRIVFPSASGSGVSLQNSKPIEEPER
jgi:hypothetical protein